MFFFFGHIRDFSMALGLANGSIHIRLSVEPANGVF